MKILFTSDLHSDIKAFQQFASLLDQYFDIGVISGDLLEDSITLSEMKDRLSLEDDDLLEELYDPDDTIEDLDQRVRDYKADPNSLLSQTLQVKEDEYRNILSQTSKPVIVIPGNHDRSKWKTGGNIINVNLSRFEFCGFNFVGFKYTSLETSEADEMNLLENIHDMIDDKTILVTHAPAFGILDQNRHGISIGSKNIGNLIQEKNIKLHLFGHVHESFGNHNKHINGAYQKSNQFVSIELLGDFVNIYKLGNSYAK